MIDKTLQTLIDFLQMASPVIWETFIRQVYISAYLDFVWAGVFLIVSLAMWRWSRHFEVRNDDRDDEEAMWICRAISVAALMICLVLVDVVVVQLSNPNYYAIQLIMKQLK